MAVLREPLAAEIKQASKKIVEKQQVVQLEYYGYQVYLDHADRSYYETQYFQRRRQLCALALGQYLHPNQSQLKMLEEVIWAICDEYYWGLPAHLDYNKTSYSLKSPTRIDLFAADTGQALAEIQSLIGSQLHPEINQRIDYEIERRLLTSFESQDWWWEHLQNNWCAVIGGCLGMVALLKLLAHSPRQTAILKRLQVSFDSYFSSFGEDGASVEGISYWAYGFGTYIYFAEMAKRVLGTSQYLDTPKAKAMAAVPYLTQLGNDAYVPFADYSASSVPSGLLSFCHDYYAVPVPAVSQTSGFEFNANYHFGEMYRNLIWTHTVPTAKAASTHYFPDAQWLVQRVPASDFVFAAKGGRNDESHNHLDLGHFIFGTQDELFLTDVGAGAYDGEYFHTPYRYTDYFAPSAKAHSIPIINGQTEAFGAVATTSKFDSNRNELNIDMTGVYPQAAQLAKYQRTFISHPEQNVLEVYDNFAFSKTANSVIENLVTFQKPQVVGKSVILQSKDKRCQLNFDSHKITINTVKYIGHQHQMVSVYQIQAAFELTQDQESVHFTAEIV